jgi:hypothetical protein
MNDLTIKNKNGRTGQSSKKLFAFLSKIFRFFRRNREKHNDRDSWLWI